MTTMRISKLVSSMLGLILTVLFTAAYVSAQDPPGRVARLSYIQGTVSLQPSGTNDWSQATLNFPLTTGDRLYTDQNSRAELELGGMAIRLSEATDLTVANLNDQMVQLGLGQGTIRVRVYAAPEETSVEIDTPNGALTVLRPGNYRVDSYPDQNTTLVTADSGSLQITGGDLNETVDSGRAVKLTGTDPISLDYVEMADGDEFDQWCQTRANRYHSSPSARYVGTGMPGYTDLDEYGRWVDTPYGPAWYPNNVASGWAPYRYGRWVWVEPWGWTWVDDAPWGFAPFHYGRWAQYNDRWCWVPGQVIARPVYAPALVAFVGGHNFSVAFSIGSVQAWFPLGPREPYFPWYHHDNDYLRRVNVTNVTNVTNITNVTNVTNINYVNRTVATTVVPGTVLRNGEPVGRQVIRITPQQISQAQVIPHPNVTPTDQTAVGGRTVAAPRIVPARVITATRVRTVQPGNNGGRTTPPVINRTGPPTTTQPGQPNRTLPPSVSRTTPGTPERTGPPVINRTGPPTTPATPERTTPPVINRTGPPTTPPNVIQRTGPPTSTEPTRNTPPVITRTAPSGESTPANSRPAQPRFVTRTPPPQRGPTLDRQQSAMQQDPGRPLEPQQRSNIQRGVPAGPSRDREVPPHREVAPARNERTSPPPERQAKPSKEEKPSKPGRQR